jgi:large subunit ribosomal protein L28
MSRVCPISGKGPISGNARSHSLRSTRRKWNVNLQKYKLNINGKEVEVRLSARAYRSLNKSSAQKAIVAKGEVKAAEVKPVEVKAAEAKPAEKTEAVVAETPIVK